MACTYTLDNNIACEPMKISYDIFKDYWKRLSAKQKRVINKCKKNKFEIVQVSMSPIHFGWEHDWYFELTDCDGTETRIRIRFIDRAKI